MAHAGVLYEFGEPGSYVALLSLVGDALGFCLWTLFTRARMTGRLRMITFYVNYEYLDHLHSSNAGLSCMGCTPTFTVLGVPLNLQEPL